MSVEQNIRDFKFSLSKLLDAASSLEDEWVSHLSSDVDDLIRERDGLLDRVAELEEGENDE